LLLDIDVLAIPAENRLYSEGMPKVMYARAGVIAKFS
jgi:hypothetical protein